MRKVLFELNGAQRLKSFESTGFPNPNSVILWDERVDGAFPENLIPSVGGLDRVGSSLVVNAQKLAAHQAAVAAEQQALAQKQSRIDNAKQTLNQALLANGDPDLSPLQIRQLFRSIKVILKDVVNQLD
jgi:hypothetical protein